MLSYVVAVGFICFQVRNLPQPIINGCFWAAIVLMVGCTVLTGWESAAITETAPADAPPPTDNKVVEVTEKVAGLSTQA